MQRVFRVVETRELSPIGLKTTQGFNRSVRDNGVIAPILVAEVPDADGVIHLEIIDGNRRVRAAEQAGIAKVPAVVLRETTAEERARLTLICNHLRSLNFFTESRAALVLGEDDRALEREARLMGLSVSKVLGMVRKLERMPEPVRQALWEERLQVSSATDIAGFPPSLQAEVVAKLEQRGWLDTRTVIAMKEDWEARHGALNPRSGGRAQRQGPPPPAPPQWAPADPVPIDGGPATVHAGGWQVRPVETPRREGPVMTGGAVAVTERPEEAAEADAHVALRREFVAKLDAAMRELAREGRELGIDLAVWVDRTMRAWDGIGT